MNVWILAATLLVIGGLLPLLLVCGCSEALEGLVALELAGTLAALILVLLTEGFKRQPLIDLALILAVVGFVGSLAFVRFMERELS